MSEIININGSTVKIGVDGGKVISVPIASLSFASPKIGDKVKVYKDGGDYIVNKEGGSSSAAKSINKHIFVWVGCFLFGGFGVDRFLRGQIGLGIVKLLFGWLTFGLWATIDWIIALVKVYGTAFKDSDEVEFDSRGKYAR